MFFLSAHFAFLCSFAYYSLVSFSLFSASYSASFLMFLYLLYCLSLHLFFSSRPSYLNFLFHFFSLTFLFILFLLLSISFSTVSFHLISSSCRPSYLNFPFLFSFHFTFFSCLILLISLIFIFHFVCPTFLPRNLISRLILLTFVCWEITFSSLTNFRTPPPPHSPQLIHSIIIPYQMDFSFS